MVGNIIRINGGGRNVVSDKVICGCDTISQNLNIPFDAYQKCQEASTKERSKLTTIIIGLILAFILTNTMWIYYFNQYDYTTVEQDGDGINNYDSTIGGDVVNGAKDSQKDEEERSK